MATLTKRMDVYEEEDTESATGNPFLFMSHEIESNKEAERLAGTHALVDEQDSPSNAALVVARKPAACAKSSAKADQTPHNSAKADQTAHKSAEADQTAHNSYLHDLYATSIEPIEHYLTGSKLLIVPEETLWTLPFATLLDPSGSHFCDKYSLQFIPSLHLLKFCLSKQPGAELITKL